MKTRVLIFSASCLLGCAQAPEYRLAQSTEQIMALQTLDPDAPINNDGITRELQGDYGKHAAENYRDSIYNGKEGRTVETQGDGK